MSKWFCILAISLVSYSLLRKLTLLYLTRQIYPYLATNKVDNSIIYIYINVRMLIYMDLRASRGWMAGPTHMQCGLNPHIN